MLCSSAAFVDLWLRVAFGFRRKASTRSTSRDTTRHLACSAQSGKHGFDCTSQKLNMRKLRELVLISDAWPGERESCELLLLSWTGGRRGHVGVSGWVCDMTNNCFKGIPMSSGRGGRDHTTMYGITTPAMRARSAVATKTTPKPTMAA